MSSQQPTLDQRRHPIGQRQEVFAQVGVLANHLVLVAQFCQSVVATPSVGSHDAARFHHFPDRRLEALASSIGDSPHSNSADAFHTFLCCYYYQRFAFRSTTTLPGSLASDEDLIDLYHPAKAIPPGSNHGPPKLVQPIPGGVITPQAKDLLKSQGAHARFLVGHIPHSL